APKFVSGNPTDVRRYFKDFEQCATAASLDEKDKISWVVHYPPGNVEETWAALPTYNGASYEAFKTKVLGLYPGATLDDGRYSHTDLELLVDQSSKIALKNRAQFGEYYREFNRISSWLVQKQKISKHEQSREFMRGFEPAFHEHLIGRLQIKASDHYPEDPYEMKELLDASNWLLAGMSAEAPVVA
ncbi:hypothetical protein CALCODRAFT_413693, partial [Calocera cornea HHB12733]